MFIMALHGLVKLYLVDIVMFYILKNSKTPVTEAFGSNSQKVGLGLDPSKEGTDSIFRGFNGSLAELSNFRKAGFFH
jgi:hypothetical protein